MKVCDCDGVPRGFGEQTALGSANAAKEKMQAVHGICDKVEACEAREICDGSEVNFDGLVGDATVCK